MSIRKSFLLKLYRLLGLRELSKKEFSRQCEFNQRQSRRQKSIKLVFVVPFLSLKGRTKRRVPNTVNIPHYFTVVVVFLWLRGKRCSKCDVVYYSGQVCLLRHSLIKTSVSCFCWWICYSSVLKELSFDLCDLLSKDLGV